MAPCRAAMIKKTITVPPDMSVKEALDIFENNNIRSLPVVDKNNKFLGLFGLRHVLLKLLPPAVNLGHGLPNLDFVVGGAPGIAKKLRKTYHLPVSDLMDTEVTVLHPDSVSWEALRVMALQGSPVPIVEEKTREFVGMVSRQTLLAELKVIMEE